MGKNDSVMAKEQLTPQDSRYISVSSNVDAELTVKRSRFIASIRRALNRQEFDEKFHEITQMYPKASSYCWGYRFNATGIIEHSSDAGEPSGTAGRPILGSLKKHSLLNTMAVVTRYYGGIKLGVKGLIEAFGDSVLKAIEESELKTFEPYSEINLLLAYDLYNILLSRLSNYGITASDIKSSFETIITVEIPVPRAILKTVIDDIQSISPNKESCSFTIRDIEDR
ncbi:MAG: YigZ family protein [Synergistaceae bacterium]|jgi:uncharacterized YigZ family protein|nr:YigZ family protein [Synergistaceae bacterium]